MNIKKTIIGLVIGIILFIQVGAMADTVYYGGSVKNKTKPACVEFDKIKVESKYHKKLPAQNDPSYNKILQQRNDSVDDAIKDVAKEKGYDVVVEKDDPALKNAANITKTVISRLKKNEE